MPASSSSSTSCQRLGWRQPGALVCASSSTSSSAGRRARAASRSNSCQRAPRCSTALARQQLEPLEQRLGLAAPVRLDHADHDIDALRARSRRASAASRRSCRRPARRRRRSSACRAAPLPRPRHLREQGIGIGAVGSSDIIASVTCAASSSARFSRSTFTRGSPRMPSHGRRGTAARSAHRDLLRRAVPQAAATRARLIVRSRQRDVRIETAAGGGHQIDRHRLRRCPDRRPAAPRCAP